MTKFEEYREKYPKFIYKDFSYELIGGKYKIDYNFSIPNLCDFISKWEFRVDKKIDEDILKVLLFNLGMVETISYWKCVCPKTLEIKCGSLSKEQILFWKKLYFNGLGEFLYRNNIDITEKDLLEISCEEKETSPLKDNERYEGCLVPIGGGKDSVVSLELLKNQNVTTFSINGFGTISKIVEAYTSKKDNYIARRILDQRLLELKDLGYLNGHIPYSAVVAFASFIAAYLTGNKYVILSNETSANEATVKDSSINHQYSKSFEFEVDFTSYIKSLITSDIRYFSLLRPLTETQIAYLFSKYKNYHSIFRSCNVGSKKGIWCCDCPKCLFVYIILSPFLDRKELIDIFGEDLIEKDSLELYFRQLIGVEENKPFECVGTRRECLASLKAFIEKNEKSLLSDKYKEIIMKEDCNVNDLLKEWVDENNLPKEFESLVKEKFQDDNNR